MKTWKYLEIGTEIEAGSLGKVSLKNSKFQKEKKNHRKRASYSSEHEKAVEEAFLPLRSFLQPLG